MSLVSISIQGVPALNRALKEMAAAAPTIAASVLTAAARRAATQTRRKISINSGLQVRYLKNRIKFYKATKARLRSSVWVGLRNGIPLASISGAQTGLGGILSVKLRGGRKLNQQTFRAKMRSGHVGQFVRAPGSRHRRRPDGQYTELPIEEPKIRIDALRAGRIAIAEAGDQMRDFYPKELKRRITLAAKKQRNKRRR